MGASEGLTPVSLEASLGYHSKSYCVKSLLNNSYGEEECNVLEEGYMRAEQDVTEHPLGVQVNECY